jgi:hypothetical protein
MAGATVQAKIWQVGKVYRRDSPVMSKGRIREVFTSSTRFLTSAWGILHNLSQDPQRGKRLYQVAKLVAPGLDCPIVELESIVHAGKDINDGASSSC